MKIVSGADMRRMDQWAIEQRQMPELLLMENAGRAVANHAWQFVTKAEKQVVVVAGKGNNGGDALVAARHLHQWGAEVHLFLLHSPEEFKNSAKVNWSLIETSGIRWYVLKDHNSFYPLKLCLETAPAVIDGICGIGGKGPLEGNYLQAVKVLNQGSATIISIDLPTGIDSDTGQIVNEAIRARLTVTLAYGKQGLYLFPGRDYAGEVVVEDISLPAEAESVLVQPTQWVDKELARSLLPMVSSGSHKGNFGHVLSLAGSRGMMGAALLSARAVLRSGGGLVTSAVPTTLADGFDLAFAEGMTLALEETTEGGLDLSVADQLTQVLADKAVFLAGPGLKQHENLPLILEQVISSIEIPAVLDAAALWAISQNDDIVKGAKGPLILTPHPGELAHLLGTTAELVQKDRCGAARSAAKEFNSIVILKGAGTIIADSQGSMFINASGNAALAIAGSGDVLAGAVAAWLAQGLQPLSAAILATYLHGAAGQRMSQELGLRGGLAGEVAELLPLLRQALETK